MERQNDLLLKKQKRSESVKGSNHERYCQWRTGLGLATISSYFNGGKRKEKKKQNNDRGGHFRELHYEVNEVARGLKN